MKKRLVFFLMVLFSILITSCASAQKAAEQNEKMARDIEGYQLPVLPTDSTAVVYVVRQSRMAGMMIPFKISIDGYPEILKNGSVDIFIIKPGSHSFRAKSENQDEILFTAEAGQTYFFEVTPKMGAFIAQAAGTPLDAVSGTYLVKKLYDAGSYIINLEDEKVSTDSEDSE